MSKIGRNDPCPCGSGKKHKRCCEGVDRTQPRQKLLMLGVVAAALVAILAVWGSVAEDKSAGGVRIWSAEHGHYHDANGVAVP